METATFTLAEAAAYLGIHRNTAYKRAESGELMPGVPVLRIGSTYRVPRARLIAAVEGDAAEGAET